MSSYNSSSTSINSDENADDLSEVTNLSRVSANQNLTNISDLSLSNLIDRSLVSISDSDSEKDISNEFFGNITSAHHLYNLPKSGKEECKHKFENVTVRRQSDKQN